MSGTKCVEIMLETVLFGSTAFIISAFLICKSNLAGTDVRVAYAERDLEDVTLQIVQMYHE